jgi:hypothetical protein
MLDLLRYLHVLTMIATVTVAVVPTVALLAITRRGDVATVRGVVPLARSVRNAAPLLFVLGATMGLVATVAGGLDPMRPWLIGSYATLTVALLAGAILADPWAHRVGAAAASSPLDSPSRELRAAIADPRGSIAAIALLGAVSVLVYLAAMRPGG